MEDKSWIYHLAVNLRLAKRYCGIISRNPHKGINPCELCELRRICTGLDKGIKDGLLDKNKAKIMVLKDIEVPDTRKTCSVCGRRFEYNEPFMKVTGFEKHTTCPECRLKEIMRAAVEYGVAEGTVADNAAKLVYDGGTANGKEEE